MGNQGPPPEPTWLKKLKGNPGKRALNTQEPTPKLVQWLDKPDYFNSEEGKLWDRVTKELANLGILSSTDRFSIERYCVLILKWRQCKEALEAYKGKLAVPVKSPDKAQYTNKDGEVIPAQKGTFRGFRVVPEIRLMLEISTSLSRIEDRFGLSPSARSKIVIEQPTPMPTGGDTSDGGDDFPELQH